MENSGTANKLTHLSSSGTGTYTYTMNTVKSFTVTEQILYLE